MHTEVVASAAAIGPTNTSETSAPQVPLIPLAGALLPTSMKGPPLSSAFTEVATDLAPVMSVSTPAMVPPEVVTISPAPTGSFHSAAASHTLM